MSLRGMASTSETALRMGISSHEELLCDPLSPRDRPISKSPRMPRSESKHSSREEETEDKRSDAKATRRRSEEDGDGNALIKKVISYFFDDDAFAHMFERFAEDHCAVFDPESDEMKLEYTEIYNEFQELFESKIEEFIQSQGSNVQQFYQLVREAYERDRESSLVLCSEILVATADFDVFVLMMKQTKESMKLAKRHS